MRHQVETTVTFAKWLEGMGDEALALGALLERADLSEPLRQTSAESINYLLRSVELIPAGVEDLGYLEVLFAFRALAQRVVQAHPGLASVDAGGNIGQLASDADRVREFLEADFPRLRELVEQPAATMAKGRSPSDLLNDADARAAALAELGAWVESYSAPQFGSGPEELVKLLSFMRTRLRQHA